jgi:DNA-binding response OmpR family regulator
MAAETTQKILIVDDEPEVRALLRAGLEAEGFAVVEAADGAQAKAQLNAVPISLVTLDLKLGGDDGLSVARELRSARNTPIIMITGRATRSIASSGWSSGPTTIFPSRSSCAR